MNGGSIFKLMQLTEKQCVWIHGRNGKRRITVIRRINANSNCAVVMRKSKYSIVLPIAPINSMKCLFKEKKFKTKIRISYE